MESPADANVPDPSAPVAPEPGSSVLLLAPSLRSDADDRCVGAALAGGGDPVRALTITLDDTVDEVVDGWDRHGSCVPEELAVVTVGDGTRSAAAVSSAGDVRRLRNDVVTTSVSDGGDLTGLGIAVSSCLEAWADDDCEVVVCFDSLTPLLQLVDTRRAFQFLHILTNRIREAGARAHFHLDPDVNDSRTMATIRSLFSVVYELGPDGTWHET